MPPSHQRDPGAAPDQVPSADLPLPIAGLYDLVLVRTDVGGLARPEAPGTALTAEELAGCARAVTESARDLRLLVDDGARDANLLGHVADALGCDILVAPAGATVERLASPDATARAEAVPVDRASGEVVDWVLVQPASLATSLPGWFDLAGGLVLERAGLVTLPLPDGLEFANREDFVLRRAAAAGLGGGHPNLMTVGLATRAGGFRLSTYQLDSAGDAQGRFSGQDVAAALSSTYLYGGDLRLWLRWPVDAAERRRLDTQVTALAEATGATVWTPPIGDEAVLLRGCRDLAARDRSGRATHWREYRPTHAPDQTRFTTDRDGRLVPLGGPQVTAAGGVALISGGHLPAVTRAERYADLAAEPGMTLLDLTILDDGRLALCYDDGSQLAAGAAELRALLEGVGWQGEDLQLLTPVPPERTGGLRDHLTALEADLGVEIWSLAPGGVVVVRDGLARAVDEQRRPARWLRAADPGTEAGPGAGANLRVAAGTGRWRNDDGWLILDRRRELEPRSAPPASPPAGPAATAPPERALPPPSPHPSVTVAARGGRPHGVRWLPDYPQVNADSIRVWLTTAGAPRRVSVEGVPAENLFLIGHLDGERLARDHPGQHLLGLRVEAGAAVDLEHVGELPAELRHLAAEADTFLLPAGWLGRARLQTGYVIDEDGRPRDETELPGDPVVLRCAGARHGTDGLPNEVARWPDSERGADAWAVIPESPAVPEGDFLLLHQRRPAVLDGHRLVHLRVAAHRAIDVPASALGLAGLTSVRSRLPELVADGVSLLLPRGSYDDARVDRVLHADGGRWRHRTKRIDLPLSSLIAPDRDANRLQPTR